MVALLLKRAKNKFQAKTTFTTSGYSRPAAPVHLCKKPDIRKMLWFRGCGDEDGGKTRVLLEGDGRNVTLPKGVMVLIAVATVVTGLYVRARVQMRRDTRGRRCESIEAERRAGLTCGPGTGRAGVWASEPARAPKSCP